MGFTVNFIFLCPWQNCFLFVSYTITFFQYNGVSMKNKTKEDAYLEMLKPADQVMFKVQNCLDSLAVIKESQGDGFFIRCAIEWFFSSVL